MRQFMATKEVRQPLGPVIGACKATRPDYPIWLLLDSRVVDVPMAYNPTFVMLSSLKPLFFNSLKNELPFSDNAGA
jgi:hypothetical protein